MTVATALWLAGIAVLEVLEVLEVLAVLSDPLGGREACSEPALVEGSVLISANALNCWILWVTCAGLTDIGPPTTALIVVLFTTGTRETLCLIVNALALSTAWLKL